MANNEILLKDVKPMLRGFDCHVIVLQKIDADPIITRTGDAIYKFLVADKTGSIILSVWGDRVQSLRSGDILRINGADGRMRRGQLEIEALRQTKVKRVGQDTFFFVDKPNFTETSSQSQQKPMPEQQRPPPTPPQPPMMQQHRHLQPPSRDPRDPSYAAHNVHRIPQLPSNMHPNFANDRRPTPPSPWRGRGGGFRGRGQDPRRPRPYRHP